MDHRTHPHRPTVFTSWKEIAQYVGKGVRTVQRWECEQGFPVHSVFGKTKRSIVAFPKEIDEWLQSKEMRESRATGPEMDPLQHSLTELQMENAALLMQIEELQKTLSQPLESHHNSPMGKRTSRLLQTAAAIQEKCSRTLEHSKELRAQTAHLLKTASAIQQQQAEIVDRCRQIQSLDTLGGRTVNIPTRSFSPLSEADRLIGHERTNDPNPREDEDGARDRSPQLQPASGGDDKPHTSAADLV